MPLLPVVHRSARQMASGGAPSLSDPYARPRDTRAGEGHQSVGGGEERRGRLWAWLLGLAVAFLGRLAWRYRRQLAAPGGILALALVVALGHAASEGLAWVPLLLGAVAAGGVLLLGHRPIHRWYAGAAGAGGTWAAAAWWVGLGDPIVLGSLALMSVGSIWIWIRHHSSRSRVRVQGGSIWPWQWGRWQFRRTSLREIRKAMKRWEVASYWGKVPRSSIRSATADIDEDHHVLSVELVAGHITLDLDNRRAASAIGAPAAVVRIVQDDRDSDRPAHVVLIQWFHAGAQAAAEPDEDEDAGPRPESEDQQAFRLERLRWAAGELGAEVVSARELARRAGLPHDWVRRWLPERAHGLGLHRVKGGWQRLAVEEEQAS